MPQYINEELLSFLIDQLTKRDAEVLERMSKLTWDTRLDGIELREELTKIRLTVSELKQELNNATV